MKEVYREVCQQEGGLNLSCVWKLKVIHSLHSVFFCGKLIGIYFRAENELLVSRNLLPLSQCFFYVCEGVVEDIDHVLVKCTVANQVWMVGLPELFELELWTLRGIGCLPY